MAKYILAHDLGTTGNKASIYNEQGKLLNSAFAEYKTYYPHANWAEQDPKDWWRAVTESTRELISKSKINKDEVAVISFSAQMMGCLPVDKEGKPLRRSIIWADQRSIKQARELSDSLGEEKVYKITGHRISPTYSVEKIMWLRDNEVENYNNTYKFLHAKDYIVSKLTGEFITDYSDASGMNLYNIREKQWSPEILEASRIDIDKLPTPHASFEVVGEVGSKVADEIGLTKGTPVVIGAGDGACASIGAGVVHEGNAYNYIGSSSWIALASKEPILDSKRQIVNWITMDPDMYMPCGTMQSAGASYNWAKENICHLEKKVAEYLEISPYKLMDLSIEKSNPTANNLIFLPYLMGERSPYWNPNAKGAFIGLTLKHNRNDILRSVMEGVTFNLKIISEIFENVIDFKEIRVIGGGAKSRIWRQIMADIYNKQILMPQILEEANSLGAAVAGGISVGIFESFDIVEELNPIIDVQMPDEDNVRKYERIYPIFKKAYHSLLDIYGMLAELDQV